MWCWNIESLWNCCVLSDELHSGANCMFQLAVPPHSPPLRQPRISVIFQRDQRHLIFVTDSFHCSTARCFFALDFLFVVGFAQLMHACQPLLIHFPRVFVWHTRKYRKMCIRIRKHSADAYHLYIVHVCNSFYTFNCSNKQKMLNIKRIHLYIVLHTTRWFLLHIFVWYVLVHASINAFSSSHPHFLCTFIKSLLVRLHACEFRIKIEIRTNKILP